MAKTQSYPNELLLEAVIRYSEEEPGKIMPARLAKWADTNMPGLKGVKGYHFTREITYKDPASGKAIKAKKPCLLRMEELNMARSATSAFRKNPLLHASDMETFFTLERPAQRELILETRATMDRLATENAGLGRENASWRLKVKELQETTEEQSEALRSLGQEVSRLSKGMSRLVKMGDEARRKAALSSIGIGDGEVDIDQYVNSLTERIDDALSINDAILGLTEKTKKPSCDILEGLDF